MRLKASRSPAPLGAKCELTCSGVGVLAVVSSLSFAPACTFVVGDEPHTHDDAGDAASAEGGDSESPEDSGAFDASLPEDAAGEPSDGGMNSALDAELADAGMARDDASMVDSALADAGPVNADCGNGGVLWYPDGDDDGFGRSAESAKRCTKPSGTWVMRGGDCKDNDGNVHPEQSTYFGESFTAADGNPSFDYDCSGNEDGNPAQLSLANGCDSILDILACTGTGYMREARTGPGVNPVCGSKKVGTCTPMLLSCTTAMETKQRPYECK